MAVKLFKRCSRRSPLPCILASASFILLWTLCSSSPSSSSSLSSSLSSSSTLEGDLKALVEFKTSIEDPHDYLADWVGVDPCSWRGVACSSPFTASNSSSTSSSSNSSSRVVKLELASVDLAGAPCIPCLLSSLQYLQALDLSSNAFSGNLSSLQSCYDIAAFNLSSNRFGGAIPSNLLTLCTHLEVLDLSSNAFSEPLDNALFSSCPALTSLDFSSNKLEGAIPPSIGWCLSLQTLDLSHNNINGSIPATFGSLRAIRKLNLAGNAISGEIPPDLSGACATLLELDLSANAISGTIPATLAKCSSLQVLNLARNSLFGPFPESIVANLHSATKLLFELNSFTGPVPVTVTANCTNLKVLDLNSNGLSGAIPDELCLPTTIALEELRLKNNKLHGNIPAALSNCTRLKVLDLSYNLLYGEIPAELTWLSDMEILSIWYNGLSGKLPPEFGAMPKLRTLVLNNNYLSGSIPVEIANCSSLEWISLSNNALSGVIPTQIGQLGRLALLELANNSLSGELPSELGNCSYLLWLDVHNNELSGNIPSRLGRFDDGPPATLILSGDHVAFLRHLEFTCSGLGSLVEFSGMSEAALNRTPLMQSCTSVRLYDGPTLNDNPDYTTIQYVDLSRNHFTGTIPMHLGHMRALQMLDLSHNHLSGPIPTTFAHLLHLGVVDISHNALNGSLWPLTNCTFLVQLDVSYNNFSGTIPSMGQLSTASESNFAGNPFLCGPPLLTCGLSSPPARACTAGTPSCLKPKAPMVTSWVNNVVLGVLISMAFLGLLLFWALIIRAKKKSKDTAAMLMLGSLHSSSCRRVGKNNSTTTGGSSSNWNLSGEREPLSINVATFERPLRKLTFSQLIEATNGFTSESLIGTGGFGEVYKATLKDGSIVAIKKLVQCSYQGDREFIAEMETLGKIKHRNLVPLLGYCKVGEERLLVYEYMHGGSLDDLLHSGVNRPWEVRKQIAKGAARGLAFLHHNCIPHIIHRDMKSSNVLLDQNLEARVSDFGMARLISALDTHLSVSTLAGTPGYVPPEYYQSFRCTAKGDVYSFGVVLLELLTGKRPTDKEEFGDSNLVGWVKVEVKQGRGVEVLDLDLTSGYLLEPKLANIATIEGYPVGTPVHEEMMKYLRIACECVDDLPSRRPTMLEVVARFKEIAAES